MIKIINYKENNTIYYVAGEEKAIRQYTEEHVVEKKEPFPVNRVDTLRKGVIYYGTALCEKKSEMNERMKELYELDKRMHEESFIGTQVKFLTV